MGLIPSIIPNGWPPSRARGRKHRAFSGRPPGDCGLCRSCGVWSGAMLHVALWEPEIPPNTGNVARLCAATGAVLHLVGRLGFHLDDRSLKRAGLDYWDAVDCRRHASVEEFEAHLAG